MKNSLSCTRRQSRLSNLLIYQELASQGLHDTVRCKISCITDQVLEAHSVPTLLRRNFAGAELFQLRLPRDNPFARVTLMCGNIFELSSQCNLPL